MLREARICADVATSNLHRAREFCEAILALQPLEVDERRGVYYRAGEGTMLNLYERAHQPSEQTVATFLVTDIESEMRSLRESGIRFEEYEAADLRTHEGVFTDATGFKACWFKDPDGNLLSL